NAISSNETSSQLLKDFEVALRHMVENPHNLVSTTQCKNRYTVARTPVNTTHKLPLADAHHRYPWTTESRRIREEVAALAKIDASYISETSSILELGLDSVDAIKLSSRLKRSGINLPTSVIMKSLTITKMAFEATTNPIPNEKSKQKSFLEDYEARLLAYFLSNKEIMDHADQILPVTPLQEAMIAEMYNSKFSLYFSHDILRLKDTVSSEKLKLAWEIVVRDTPILRTSFHEVDDPDIPFSYAQIVHRSERVMWNTVRICKGEDLQAIADKARVDAIQATANKPAASITMLEGDEERYLILSLAHALYDGWSLDLLHEDVRKAYYGVYLPRCSNREILGHILNFPSLEAAEFWKDNLSGVKATHFPNFLQDYRRNSKEAHHLKLHSPLPAADLKHFCKVKGVTPQALGQTCWAFVLASYTKALEVVFGTVLFGRDTESACNAIFPTMNTVAIRAILHGTREEMLQYMQENISNATQHQQYPLRKAQASVNLGGRQLFDTLFIYQKRPERNGSDDNTLYESVDGFSAVEYPVCVEMELIDDILVWRTACKAKNMNIDSVREIIDRLELVLREIVQSPGAKAVAFTEHEARVCGLPPFYLNSEPTSSPDDSTSQRVPNHLTPTSWSAVELSIRKVLSVVSKVPENEITKDLTLFHLGLDSISTIKASSLLRKKSIKVSVNDMLRAATIEKIALLVEADSTHVEASMPKDKKYLEELVQMIDARLLFTDVGIDVKCIESYTLASTGQVYMLSAWQNSMGTAFYPCFLYQLKRVLDRKRLDKAWQKLLKLSSILRTTFLATERRDCPFIQVIFRSVQNPIIWLPSEEAPSCQPPTFNHPPVTLYAHQLSCGTLLRLEIHHALFDGVSLPVLMQQLRHLYDRPEEEISTTPKHEDFLALSYISPEQHCGRRKFWKTYLDSSRSLMPSKPAARRCQRVEVFEPGIQDAGTTLESVARSRGLSVHAMFLAAYSKVHAKLLDGTDSVGENGNVAFGIYLANRGLPIEGLSTLPAPTLNLVPLRTIAPMESSIINIAKSIQADLQDISSMQNSGVGLWEVEEWTGLKFNCFVNFLKLPDLNGEGESQNSFELAAPKRKSPRREVVEPRTEDFVEPKALKGNMVRDVYMPSLDIEATIQDGHLDIGVFCPEELLSLEDVDRLISDIRETLSDMNRENPVQQ
ncbi:hypothetical protein GP486_007392, partial [Trichoglossum hirsutum]